ncbi:MULTISPECIES: hypothetical protein [Glutamicibacter]|uniref:DUF4259 domain-containing protein n=1 Tax=Glutamicibacter halophytocola TaxID=1933880 RepID=A0AA95BR20_9MICC|nr:MULTISPECIES: hypothetical protein [Glutamicibacter]MBF6670396.1 hypothetical protein [Glutamicibacter sp. FBE19]UUX58799.1 hypothetical protein NUH22_16145 [Glutamicibacter halophytocola]
MGAWGASPWDSDGAADWFTEFFEGIDVDARIAAALEYDDEYDQIRAACYMLNTIGRIYVWPGDLEKLEELLGRGIELLAAMLESDSEFRELYEEDDEVIEAVEKELADLKERLADNTSEENDD